MPVAYATVADLEANVEGWVTDDPAAALRLLERASGDVDYALGPRTVLASGAYAGRKLDPTVLQPVERDALIRATCVQAEHRVRNPELFTGERLASTVHGPDFAQQFSVTGDTARGRFSDNLRAELEPLARYRVLTAATGPRRYTPGT